MYVYFIKVSTTEFFAFNLCIWIFYLRRLYVNIKILCMMHHINILIRKNDFEGLHIRDF